MKKFKVTYITCHGFKNTVEIVANNKEHAEWVIKTYCVIDKILKIVEIKKELKK